MKEVSFIVQTQPDRFAGWLQELTADLPFRYSFPTERGQVLLHPARFTDRNHLTMMGTLVVPSKDSRTATVFVLEDCISFILAPLSRDRLEVSAAYNHWAVMGYFLELLREIARRWEESTSAINKYLNELSRALGVKEEDARPLIIKLTATRNQDRENMPAQLRRPGAEAMHIKGGPKGLWDMRLFARGEWPGTTDAFQAALTRFDRMHRRTMFGPDSPLFTIVPHPYFDEPGERCWMVAWYDSKKGIFTVRISDGYLAPDAIFPYAEVRAQEAVSGLIVELLYKDAIHTHFITDQLHALLDALVKDGLVLVNEERTTQESAWAPGTKENGPIEIGSETVRIDAETTGSEAPSLFAHWLAWFVDKSASGPRRPFPTGGGGHIILHDLHVPQPLPRYPLLNIGGSLHSHEGDAGPNTESQLISVEIGPPTSKTVSVTCRCYSPALKGYFYELIERIKEEWGIQEVASAVSDTPDSEEDGPRDESTGVRPWEEIPDHKWYRQALELWWAGHTCPAIGRRLGYSAKTVTSRLSELRCQYGTDVVPTDQQRRRNLIKPADSG